MAIDNDNNEPGTEDYQPDDSILDLDTPPAPGRPDLSKITLDGDDIPEDFRGKSAAEVLAEATRLRNALQISEDARLALRNSQSALDSGRQTPVAPAPAAPAEDPVLTLEQERELFEKDQFEYQQYKNQQLEKRFEKALSARIQPVVGNTADIALREARSRFPDEFAALETEIKTVISGLNKADLAAPGAIDQLIYYVRGQHIDKLLDFRSKKAGKGLDDARGEAANEAPTVVNRAPRVPSNGGRAVNLDETELEIARELGLTPEEYNSGRVPSRQRRA